MFVPREAKQWQDQVNSCWLRDEECTQNGFVSTKNLHTNNIP